MKLKGKKVLITGGSHGIGRSMVDAFIQEGAEVLFTAYTGAEVAEEMCTYYRRLGISIYWFPLNCLDTNSVSDLVLASKKYLGNIDILVNNVAITTREPFLSISEANFDNVMQVNIKFPFFLSQHIAQLMVEQKIQGNIINISSISAFKAMSRMAHYQASKAALSMLTKSLALELGEYGIRVNAILPGLTATKTNQEQWKNQPQLWQQRSKQIPLQRAGEPQDHAQAAVFLASEEAAWITGSELTIDGGYSVL